VKGRRQQAARRNFEVFLDYYYRLEEIATNIFEWSNLPDTVDPRFLEITLVEEGKILFFEDNLIGHLALQFVPRDKIDIYRIPIDRTAYSWNGYRVERNAKNSVIIWNNYFHTPTAPTLALYASRLAEIERTIEVNVRGQKTPVVVICSEQERLSLENAYKDYDGNVPVIFASKHLDLSQITSIPTAAPFVSDKLQTLKKQIWNEALTFLGVNNGASEKKERLVSVEAEGSQGGVAAQRVVMLNSRREAAKKINQMFGLNIEVNLNEEILTSGVPGLGDVDGKANGLEGGSKNG